MSLHTRAPLQDYYHGSKSLATGVSSLLASLLGTRATLLLTSANLGLARRSSMVAALLVELLLKSGILLLGLDEVAAGGRETGLSDWQPLHVNGSWFRIW